MSGEAIRRRLSFANVASALALFIAIGGGTAFGLAGHNTVTSDDIVAGNVRTADIAKNAVTASKINNAASGSDAVNADKLDGVSGENYQLGDGINRGDGFIEIPNGQGLTTAVNLSGGHLSFTCGATTSTLSYIDDASSPTFTTDLWLGEGNNTHSTVADGGSKTNLIPPAQDDGTVRFQVFAEAVDNVTFSWLYDSGSDQCTIASSVQTNGFLPALFPRRPGRSHSSGSRPAP